MDPLAPFSAPHHSLDYLWQVFSSPLMMVSATVLAAVVALQLAISVLGRSKRRTLRSQRPEAPMRAAPRQDLARSLSKQESGASHESADLRARAIGALGEGLVTAELEAIGYPFLRNLILDFGNRTVEIDHIIKVPDGLIVLEVKTFRGFIIGSERDLHWTQVLRGQRNKLLNPALQSLAHVRAMEEFIADPRLHIRGFVVSAGTARFSDEIARIPIPLNRLRDAIEHDIRKTAPENSVRQAWERLSLEASLSPGRLENHLRYAEGRKQSFSRRTLGAPKTQPNLLRRES